MKHSLFYIAILLTLLSCSSHPGEVHIQGRFAHLEQGEFFICSSDGGLDRMDTLHIQDGKFKYQFHLEGSATMHIIYPNLSQLTVFATSGDDIKVEGDAQNLKEVTVKGNEDNELFSAFRQETLQKSASEVRSIAKQYILEHPQTAMSQYLFKQHFLLEDSVPQKEVKEIYDSLCHACPDNSSLAKLSNPVRTKGMLDAGQKLPPFSLKIRQKTKEGKDSIIQNTDYEGKYLLIAFWSGWSGTQSAVFSQKKLRRRMKDKDLQLISYSLDSDEKRLKHIEEQDTITYPSYCDYQVFSSPLAEKWGIRALPFYVLIGPDQKIIASGNNWSQDIEPKTKDLCS